MREEYVLQYKVKRRGTLWKDYIFHSQLERVMVQYAHIVNSSDPWWKNKEHRVIHRMLQETVLSQENDQT